MTKLIVLRVECADCRSVNEMVLGGRPDDRRRCRTCGKVLKRETIRVLGLATMDERRKKPRE